MLGVPQIRDKEGRFWDIKIDLWNLRRVRQALDINLLEILEKESSLGHELDDPVRSVELIWCLCQPQAAEREISEQSFWEALDQDMLDAAGLAILEGLANFSRAAVRPAMAKVAEKTRKLQETLSARVVAVLASGELDRMLDAEMSKLLQAGSGEQNEKESPPPAAPASGQTTSSITASNSLDSSGTLEPSI
jgi:hypothetical protein